jgi:4-amino-4-deoxy-L-arabinose transferase-like glycosyltransferase
MTDATSSPSTTFVPACLLPRMPTVVFAGLAGLTVLRVAIAAALPLGDDETFYWEWSRHLAAAYVDHPPAIAFLVWLATRVGGSTPLAIHSVAILFSLATSLALWALAREVLGRDAAATGAVILFNLIPVFSAGAVLAAPDAPLGLCWILTLLWAWRAAGRGVPAPSGVQPPIRDTARSAGDPVRPWLAAGVWLGLALESKYTAAVLPFCLGLWLALSPRYRRWLSRPEPYYALAVAAALFGPVIWWNATHRWASFSFNVLVRPAWAEGGNFAVFLLFQFTYLAPLLFPVLLWALGVAARRGRAGEEAWLFLAAVSIPLIAGMFAASLVGHIKGHWAAPAYATAAIALAGLATERPWAARTRVWRGAAAAVLGSTAVITLAIHAIPVLGTPFLPARLDPTVDYYGWPQAAQEISAVAVRDARGPFFVTSEQYQLVAQFDFATGGRYPVTTITGIDQYAFWTRWGDLQGRDGLFIIDARYRYDVDLTEGCRALESEAPVSIVRRGVVVRALELVWCRDFSGRPIVPHRRRQ